MTDNDLKENIAIISTSDRTAFRSCRRKWNWSSPLRGSLAPITQRLPLWFGSGMHHVLEDFHGKQLYKSVDQAVEDYYQATKKYYGAENLPDTADTDIELMKRMLQHYKVGWLQLRKRDPLKTYTIKGEPQVEVPFEFEIPLTKEFLKYSGYTRAIYRGTIDRVVIDEDGYLWLQDYKSVSKFTNPDHLELDSQIGVYLWAASYIYKRPVIGFIYTEFFKKGVESPKVLKSGAISTDQSQPTNYSLYRAALVSAYGEDNKWPEDNVRFLNVLATMEEDEADKFIKRTRITRSQHTMNLEADKIIAEVTDMLDPNLKIYPSPSFMCPMMCSFVEPCLQLDRGENYRTYLSTDYTTQTYSERNEWRKYLKVGDTSDKEPIQANAETSLEKIFKENKNIKSKQNVR